ncbi:alpha/beta hydrolase family protein [Mangrovibacterium sp.]|uniref:alpha/beta hydrolase family protein n=1 Tax=Mangrovibacterium sp. TaxID=1961364 RepID=UPI0035685E4D
MKQIKLTIIGIVLLAWGTHAQLVNSDNKFQRPLAEVLKDVEARFDVELRISGESIEGKMLDYADWRVRPELEETLDKVLAPFDLIALPDGASNKFKIEGFRYHRRTEEEAQQFLGYLSGLYSMQEEWEVRRAEIKACLSTAVRLDKAPDSPGTKPILSKTRKMEGYTIQNIALEILPGVYVCGSIYRPAKIKGKIPVVLCPNGHFGDGRYNPDMQSRCAGLARMGAMSINYDLFGWGESTLQFESKYHQKSLANTIQVLTSIRLLDYLLSFDYADSDRVGITGGSGGGSHTMLISAIEDRIDVSVPVVMMSAIHYGGCPCESGNPIHLCGGGTNNVEIAGLFAPKPQLIVSDGGDWTANVPEMEFPFLKRIYSFYGPAAVVENVHLPNEKHDYGPSKRAAMYHFMAKELKLDKAKVFGKDGQLNESAITIEKPNDLKIFGDNGEELPASALRNFELLEAMFK